MTPRLWPRAALLAAVKSYLVAGVCCIGGGAALAEAGAGWTTVGRQAGRRLETAAVEESLES